MIVTPEKVRAYAHCRNPMCPGYGQEQVAAVRTEVAWTYGDGDPKSPFKNMIDRSTIMFSFEDDEDRACRSCGADRELTADPRPSYQALSGFDPMGLVNGTARFDPSVVNTAQDAELAELKAQMAQQAKLIAQLLEKTGDVEGEAA